MTSVDKGPLVENLIEDKQAEEAVQFKTLEWRNINYTLYKNNKTILDQCSGIAREGDITALIGSSGAGKTSLLNLLAHKLVASTGKITGTISFKNQKINKTKMKNISSYLRQEDIFHVNLTPRGSTEMIKKFLNLLLT